MGNNYDTYSILRAQAWERALGNLKSMLWTFTCNPIDDGKFEILSKGIEELEEIVSNNEIVDF